MYMYRWLVGYGKLPGSLLPTRNSIAPGYSCGSVFVGPHKLPIISPISEIVFSSNSVSRRTIGSVSRDSFAPGYSFGSDFIGPHKLPIISPILGIDFCSNSISGRTIGSASYEDTDHGFCAYQETDHGSYAGITNGGHFNSTFHSAV